TSWPRRHSIVRWPATATVSTRRPSPGNATAPAPRPPRGDTARATRGIATPIVGRRGDHPDPGIVGRVRRWPLRATGRGGRAVSGRSRHLDRTFACLSWRDDGPSGTARVGTRRRTGLPVTDDGP